AWASSQSTGAVWAEAKGVLAWRPVERRTKALKVLGVGVVSRPSGMRPAATASRSVEAQVGGGREQRASARRLSPRITSTLGRRWRALASGGRGAGVRSEIPCRTFHFPLTTTRARWTTLWTKQVSGVAAWRKRLSQRSNQKQTSAAAKVMAGSKGVRVGL